MLPLLALSAGACESTTTEGYKYDIIKDLGQPPVEIGDEAIVYFEIRTTDTLIFATPGKSGISTILVDPAMNRVKKTGPIADVLPLLGEGDSAIVRMPIGEEMRITPGLETADEIFYHVVVRKVNRAGSEEFGKTQAQPMDRASSNEPAANKPNFRANLKAAGKGIKELRELGKFIGHVKVGDPELGQTDNGLYYRILDPGQGERIKAAEQIEVHHLGSLTDGTIFAETYTNEIPFSFVYQQGRVIKGWDQGLGLVRKGGKILLAVPPELAYGQTGKEPFITPNDTLYYYLEVVN
jgi:FKBP-type peptidyl-prolyl cis-trans isomerase